MKCLRLGSLEIGQGRALALISGPCVIEDESLALSTAETLCSIAHKLGIGFIYKSSYDKANRSSYHSFRGPGLEEGLRILEKVKRSFDVPILTDVHTPYEAKAAAEVCDVLQIPAFLCRQTDLLVAAAQTGKAVNIKKGQFLAPWDMKNAVDKILATGHERILLTERGACFGYNNLVSDMRSIPIMQSLGFPVCFDATHSVQLPGGKGSHTGGQREFIPCLAYAALAAGADCLFLESHPDPTQAKSDAESVYPLSLMESFLHKATQLYACMRS